MLRSLGLFFELVGDQLYAYVLFIPGVAQGYHSMGVMISGFPVMS